MSTLKTPIGIVYGVPDPMPFLDGFLVIARRDQFLKARCALSLSEYFVRDTGPAWELWRCLYDGEKTPGNPRGEALADQPPLTIQKLCLTP